MVLGGSPTGATPVTSPTLQPLDIWLTSEEVADVWTPPASEPQDPWTPRTAATDPWEETRL